MLALSVYHFLQGCNSLNGYIASGLELVPFGWDKSSSFRTVCVGSPWALRTLDTNALWDPIYQGNALWAFSPGCSSMNSL